MYANYFASGKAAKYCDACIGPSDVRLSVLLHISKTNVKTS